MRGGTLNFFSGLAQGFGQTLGRMKETQRLEEQNKKERDAKMKLFEIQLQREQAALAQQEKQAKQREAVYARMQPQFSTDPATPDAAPTPGKSLTDLLADPQASMELLQAGMIGPDDLIKLDNDAKQRKMIEGLMSGGGGKGMEMTGFKVGPDGRMMPDFGLPQITTQTVMEDGAPRIGTFNSRTGAKVADIGAAKPDNIAPDVAGRLSGLQQAQGIAQELKSKFIKPDGSVDRGLIMTTFGRLPGSAGRQVRNDIGIAVDAVLRARTGAGVNKDEMVQVVEQFLPGPLDGDALVQSKMDRLQEFVSGTLDIATLPPALRKRLEGAQPKVVDWSELK